LNVFRKQKGTVSVLLTLLLVPTLIISGLVTDAARVYGAKSIISDAGMLAMNAGLTYYDSELKDDYGLLALGTAVRDLDIEKYFINTIRASGIDGAENVSTLLDLSIEDKLEVTGVSGSEIYQTEVEKAQILEYMKYRAPVVIAEELWDKLKEIKENQKKIEALNAQADFTDELEDLQDACEKAKEAIDAYLELEEYRVLVGSAEANTKASLKDCAFHIMLGTALWPMTDPQTPIDFMDAFAKFTNVTSVLKEDYPDGQLKDAELRSLFEQYIYCVGCKQFLLQDNSDNVQEREYITKKFEDMGFSYQDAEQQYDEYMENKGIVSQYLSDCISLGTWEITTGNEINSAMSWLLNIQNALEHAVSAVNDLKIEWMAAKNSHEQWESAVGQLSGDGENSFKSAQEECLKEYEDMFTDEAFDVFVQKMNDNITYAKDGQEYFKGFTFMGIGLADTLNAGDKIVDAIREIQFTAKTVSDVETRRDELIRDEYVVTDKTFNDPFYVLKDDDFYKKLCELCTEQEKDSKKTIKDNKSKVKSIYAENNYVAFEKELNDELEGLTGPSWTKDKPQPSAKLEELADTEASKIEPSSTTDVTKKSERKSAVKKAKESLENVQTFLSKVDDLFTSNLENLYLMEYGIQMFSYYTVDKDSEGNTIESGITSMSGDDLTAHVMYKSEAEYILWGKNTAKDNINNTRMLLYGIRFVFDLIYAFTDTEICAATKSIALCLSFGIAFVVPIINFVLKVAVAAVEAAYDVQELMKGKSVPLFKDSSNSHVAEVLGEKLGLKKKRISNQSALTMNYKEYLTVFLMIHMVGTFETTALARMADCIQLNTSENLDITTSYTMIAVSADVKVRTTFLRKASAWSGSNSVTSDYYTISYKSCLGY
jgi:hypothetical protein